MSISLSTMSTLFVEFVNETLIPVLDNNNPAYTNCVQKWQEFVETIVKKISNFTSDQELKQKVKSIINKTSKKQRVQKPHQQNSQSQISQRASSIRVTFTQAQKLPKTTKTQDITQSQKIQAKQRQQTIQFRDRKTSLDEVSSRKSRYDSQIILRKDERSGSFNLPNGLDGDIVVQIPLILTPTQQAEKPKSSYARKDNEVMSFNSISDFHKSRNNIPAANKQTKQSQLPLILPQQLKMMSKKSIQEFAPTSITQSRPNSYSSNYIQSIKKINTQSRSPNSKSKPVYSDIQGPQDFVQTTPVKMLQPQVAGGSTLSNIKKKISQGSEYMNSPPPGSSDSFSKFMNSFKKLCNTFESNHHKLMREDFNNKYINC